MLFIIRVQTGATAALAQRLSTSPSSSEEITVAVEGPYGRGRKDVGKFGEVLLIAGGSGITHVMSGASFLTFM
jgi:NAD(P)H-flavin reductase